MRQRLGIAIALLNTPEFLILDEPINGLDPAGIVEIRNLLKSLNKEYGMTILVSSHILEELYQTASEFILIDKGKIIEEISDHELNERCKRHIAIKTTDPQKALIVLEEKLHTENVKLLPDGVIRLYDYLDDMEKVAAALSDAHILVSKDTQGIGLGLPLAKAIIEAHNGSVEVDSELGTGTTFTINFLIPTKL